MILGIHGSVSGGLETALLEAADAGCAALQMLPYKRHAPPSVRDLEAFRRRRAASGVRRLLVHSRYVPSLASSRDDRRQRSVALLSAELALAEGLNAEAYILHAGAYSEGATVEEGSALAAKSIVEAFEGADFKGTILIENVPGGGRRLCGSLEEMERIGMAMARAVKWGVCLDTAHAWAAGYDVASAQGMSAFLARVHGIFGDRARAFHVNDTRALRGSHREDHAHWGEGRLGKDGVKVLLARAEYAEAVGIVETPKTPGGDRRNLLFLGSAS